MEQLLLFCGVDRRQGDDGHCTGDRGATCPEIGAGMQGGEATIEPGITHQCWKAIHALQLCWCSAEVGGIPAVFLLKTLIPLTGVLLIFQGIAGIASILLAKYQT